MSVTVNYFNYTTLRDYASHQCVPIVASMFLCGKLICEGAVARIYTQSHRSVDAGRGQRDGRCLGMLCDRG